MSIKSEIAPKGFKKRPTELMIGSKYVTILSIISYPKFISIPPSLFSLNTERIMLLVFGFE